MRRRVDIEEENREEKKKLQMQDVLERYQQTLIDSLDKYVEQSQYDKEIDTLRKLCQKIMDLYQVSKNEIDRIDKETKDLTQADSGEVQKQIKELKKFIQLQQEKNEKDRMVIESNLMESNQKEWEKIKLQFDQLSIKVKEISPVSKTKKTLTKVLDSNKELETNLNKKVQEIFAQIEERDRILNQTRDTDNREMLEKIQTILIVLEKLK